jgi:anti-sigma factor RsiW
VTIFGKWFGKWRAMSCHQVAELLQTYLDSELDDDRARRVAAHLDDCRRCGLEAEVYEALRDSLQRRALLWEDEPVERLREFGQRLARGEMDPGGMPTS